MKYMSAYMILSVAAAFFTLFTHTAYAENDSMIHRKPIVITSQGSFAAGGTVIREKGTYEEAHALSPEGQEKHVDHGYVFIRYRQMPGRMPFSSCMAPGRAGPAGKLRRMAGKVSRLFSS